MELSTCCCWLHRCSIGHEAANALADCYAVDRSHMPAVVEAFGLAVSAADHAMTSSVRRCSTSKKRQDPSPSHVILSMEAQSEIWANFNCKHLQGQHQGKGTLKQQNDRAGYDARPSS
ncbi:unnamed protein product [Victoria cruziana]